MAVGDDDVVGELVGRGTEVVDLAGRMLLPGFQDAHVHPVGGGLDLLQCDLHDLDSREDYLRGDRRRTPHAHPDRDVDPRRRLVDGRRSPAARPTEDVLDAVVPGPPGLPAEPRRPRRLGQHPRAGARRASTRDDARPGRRPDRARRRTASPSGTLHEGAHDLVDRLAPAADARGAGTRACSRARRYLHSLGITALAGRDRRASLGDATDYSRRTSRAAERGDAHRPRRRRAVVGPRARRSSRSTTSSTRGRAARSGASRPRA